jgi:hypothetical protein
LIASISWFSISAALSAAGADEPEYFLRYVAAISTAACKREVPEAEMDHRIVTKRQH